MALDLLHHDLHGPERGASARTALVLHGIFGSRRNWRSIAKALALAHPQWRFVTVDLRNHGDSHPAVAPHDLEACAADLDRLGDSFGGVQAVVGHSFGGKVALAHARQHPATGLKTFVLDSPVGAGAGDAASEADSEVGRMIAWLNASDERFERRSMVTEVLLERGFSRGVATWMATNLEAKPEGGYGWHFDPAGVKAMLASYWATDFYPWLEASQPLGSELHFVLAGASDRWKGPDRERLARVAERAEAKLSVLEGAGHWLHVDDPEGLLDILRPAFEG